MDVLLFAFLSAALTAGFILAVRWAWREDHSAHLRERFDEVVQGWGKE